MSAFLEMIEKMTPEIYRNLKSAVELGKWTDGRRLTPEQKETCLEAVLAWELRFLPEDQRTGYMEQACKSHGDMDDQTQPIGLH